MLKRWLTRLEPVHKADTREELDAVYRFRYTIYVEEFGRELGAPDHERQRLSDPEDEKESSTILYTGRPDAITGTVRLRHWRPGTVPEYERRELSMDLFPDLDQRSVGEIGRFMIRRSMRGKLILAAFSGFTYDYLAGEQELDLVFCYCAPGLVRYYRRLGGRPFGGRVVPTPDGMMVPLVSVLSDYGYYKRHGSPGAPLVRHHFGPGKRPPLDLAPYRHLFESGTPTLELDAERVWGEVQDALLEEPAKTRTFFDALDPEVVKRLSAEGFIMDVPAGTLVTRKEHSEREMFVVIEGLFEALDGERRLQVLGKGELFGEIAFFRPGGRRSATVRAVADGRVVVVRAKSLEKLIDQDPRIAAQILLAIGGIMADRVAWLTSIATPVAEEEAIADDRLPPSGGTENTNR